MTLPRVPRRGERVRIDGHAGTFIVVRIDKVEGFASVELWDNPIHHLQTIPFSAIHRISEDVNQVVARIVREGTEPDCR